MDPNNINKLKATVSETLESKGFLGKLKAQLRAGVLSALQDEQPGVFADNASSKKIQASAESRLLIDLVRELLEFYEMEYTLSVFLPEANLPKTFNGRASLAKQLQLTDNSAQPLLLEVFRKSQASQISGSGSAPSATSGRPIAALSTAPKSASDIAKAKQEEEREKQAKEQERLRKETEEQAKRLASDKAKPGLSSLGSLPSPFGKKPSVLPETHKLPGTKASFVDSDDEEDNVKQLNAIDQRIAALKNDLKPNDDDEVDEEYDEDFEDVDVDEASVATDDHSGSISGTFLKQYELFGFC
eukprot:TRINITY_DN19372_c0_g1_i1.p1 TRINITY_DN19372_c0_g1~~TRINITY_DN19372_c0_g1_i1.p1  ORF type:complete len:315 (+),score=-0.75 TRINITY_DN19372_c0_g1_i1:44-946(+)